MRTEEVVFENGDKTVHTFNDAELCVRTTDYDAAGNIRYDIQYEVDSWQRVVGWKVFDGNGNAVKRFEVDFDSRGLEIEKRQYGANGKLERLQRYVYDDDNRRIEEQHFEEPIQTNGRPRLPLADIIFAATYKTYTMVSARRFASDLRDALAKGLYLTDAVIQQHLRLLSNAIAHALFARADCCQRITTQINRNRIRG